MTSLIASQTPIIYLIGAMKIMNKTDLGRKNKKQNKVFNVLDSQQSQPKIVLIINSSNFGFSFSYIHLHGLYNSQYSKYNGKDTIIAPNNMASSKGKSKKNRHASPLRHANYYGSSNCIAGHPKQL